jgi:alpha-galactosidase
MAGVLGIGADLLAWDAATRERASSLVESVVHTGRVRRHGSPADEACAVQYTGADAVVVLAWRRPGAADLAVHLRDLDPDARYRLRGDGARTSTFTGKELITDGIAVGWTWEDCAVMILDRV